MGSEQSSQLPAGAPGSSIKSQRDEDIPYTSYSISKPIAGGNRINQILVIKLNCHLFENLQEDFVVILFDR